MIIITLCAHPRSHVKPFSWVVRLTNYFLPSDEHNLRAALCCCEFANSMWSIIVTRLSCMQQQRRHQHTYSAAAPRNNNNAHAPRILFLSYRIKNLSPWKELPAIIFLLCIYCVIYMCGWAAAAQHLPTSCLNDWYLFWQFSRWLIFRTLFHYAIFYGRYAKHCNLIYWSTIYFKILYLLVNTLDSDTDKYISGKI